MAEDVGGLREKLVDAALVLLEEGAERLSLRGVAQAAGVSAMAPYRHFADKAALIGAVAARGFADLRHALEVADLREADVPERALIAQGLAYIAFAGARPALFRLMFADPRQAHLPEGCARAAYGVLAERVAGMAGPDAEVAMLGCWAIVHGLAMLILDGRTEADAGQQRAVVSRFAATLR